MIEWIELFSAELKKKMTVFHLKGPYKKEKFYKFVLSKKKLGLGLHELEPAEVEILRQHKN